MQNDFSETQHIGNETSDTELISRFLEGDKRAFTEIVLRYQKPLLQVASTVIGDENEAQDMVQETFVKIYFNIHTFRGKSSLYTWMYRILYNQCISLLRKKKIFSFVSFDNHDFANLPSKILHPGKVCENNEIKDAVKKAMTKLPAKQRMIFAMKQIDGLKHEEIARILGITEGAVKASYFHAIQKLKELLADHRG